MIQLMQGFPPAADTQVDLSNWRKPPFNRWAYSHVNEICLPLPYSTIQTISLLLPKRMCWS